MAPGAACTGVSLRVAVYIRLLEKEVTISCNGAASTRDIAAVTPSLNLDDVLGRNDVTDTLEGKYPLARVFPGQIIERPVPN